LEAFDLFGALFLVSISFPIFVTSPRSASHLIINRACVFFATADIAERFVFLSTNDSISDVG
jgi:hypothetical protein